MDLPSFGLEPKDREIVLLEPFFTLGYYFGMTWETFWSFPVSYRMWLLKRIHKEINQAASNENDIPSKAPHHNDAQTRHMLGKFKPFTGPAKTQRFT